MLELGLLILVLILVGANGVRYASSSNSNATSSEPERRKRVKAAALAYKVQGVGLWFASGFVFMIVAQTTENILLIIIFFWVSSKMFSYGMESLRYGRRLEAVPAGHLLELDPRPPVVYFRSFEDDEIGSQSLSLGGIQGGKARVVILTEEEQIAKAMQAIGPVIALGKPGEELPQVGAARRYAKGHEDWHDVVTEYVTNASAVVMRAGLTEGFWWEFQLAVQLMPPERILVLIPFSLEEYQLFRSRAERYLRYNLPPYNGKKVYGSLTGCILFEPDWTPHFRRMRWYESRFFTASAPLVTILEKMCAPFFAQCKFTKGEDPAAPINYYEHKNNPTELLWKILALLVLLFVCILPLPEAIYELFTEPSLPVVFQIVIMIAVVYLVMKEEFDFDYERASHYLSQAKKAIMRSTKRLKAGEEPMHERLATERARKSYAIQGPISWVLLLILGTLISVAISAILNLFR